MSEQVHSEVPAAAAVLSEGRRIARNSALLGLGDVVNLLLGLATTVLVTDYLGDRYGVLLGAQRFVGMFLVLAQFGLYPLLVRSIAARPGDVGPLLGTVLALRAFLGLAFALLVGIAMELTSYLPGQHAIVLILVAAELFGVFTETHVAVCDGRERMGSSALVTSTRPIATFLGLLVVMLFDLGLGGMALAYAASRMTQLAVAVTLARRAAPGVALAVRFDWMEPMLREALLFVAIGLSFTAMSSLDVVLLTRLSSVEQASWYGGALNFFDVLLAVPVLAQRSLLPAFTRLGVERKASEVARATLQIFGALLLPASIGLAVLAPEAVNLYPSHAFGPSAPALRVLAFGVPFAGIALACAVYLTGAQRLPSILRGYAVALPVQIGVSLLLIPFFGSVGAAAGRLAAHGALALALLSQVRGAGVGMPAAPLARHAAAAGCMAVVLVALAAAPLALRVGSGALVYGTIVLATSGRASLERTLALELVSLARGALGRLRRRR